MLRSGANFSDDRVYRYSLWREWLPKKPRLLFVMLNPSTADENRNDPTVERCQVRAMRDGFGSLEVVNLFAYRSTYWKKLWEVPDPVGPGNDDTIDEAIARSGEVICAWGCAPIIGRRFRDERVLRMITARGRRPLALKLTADGHPHHPLYLSYSLRPVEIHV